MKNIKLTPVPVLATTADDLSRLLIASIELEEMKKENKILKDMCKLTDFTAEELAFAMVAIEEAKDQAIHCLAKHEVIGTNPESDQVKFWQRQAYMSITWQVQLETALAIVKDRETVNSN